MTSLATEHETLALYTAQSQVVLDTIEREGASRVKREFIAQKYGDEAWVFQQAYTFFAQNAGRYVAQPEGAESGIWCYADPAWATMGADGVLLQLQVPSDQAVLFDLRIWNRMLNLEYVCADDADEQAFERRIESMGLKGAYEAFSTPFYPQVKSEITKSWQRLFGSAENCPETYVQAGLWEIRREWLVEIKHFAG